MFQKIRDNLRTGDSKDFKQVDEFDMGLLQDDQAGKKKKFEISEDNLPNYLVFRGTKKTFKQRHLVEKCQTVTAWLNVFRNQVSTKLSLWCNESMLLKW